MSAEYTPERRKNEEPKVLPPQQVQPSNARAAEVSSERRRRKDTGPLAGLKLAIPEDAKDPNFEYRWLNDEPGRIHNKTVNDDWDVVTMDQLKGYVADDNHAGEGTPVTRVIERGGSGIGGQPRKAVLVRKRKEYFEEDKRAAQARIDAREEGIRRGAAQAPEGLQGPNAYVPGGVNQITHGR